MPEASPLNITDIDSRIAGYRTFFDSTREVNEQVFLQNRLTSTQNLFFETLREFDSYTKSNRNPGQDEEVSLKVVDYIDSLDQIEEEIRLEQEKRLASNNSSQIGHLFHQEDSFQGLAESDGSTRKSSFETSLDQESFDSHPDANLTAEEMHLKASYINSHEKIASLNADACALFSVLKSTESKGECPEFLAKKQSGEHEDDEFQGAFFQISIKSDSLQYQEKQIQVGRLKKGGFVILAKSHDRTFQEIQDADLSRKLFNSALKIIYVNSGLRHSVLDARLYKIANGFYIDEAGEIVCHDPVSNSLCVTSPIDITDSDRRIIEGEIDLDSVYRLLTDKNYAKSTQSIELSDKSKLTLPKSCDQSRDGFAVSKNQGLIQLYRRKEDQSFQAAKSSRQALEFAKKLESGIKDTLIFDAFYRALKGNWGLLNKISLDPRITKKSIAIHVQDYLSSSKDSPFDINFLAKIAINVESLGYHVSKLIIDNRSHFLPQIIYGHLDPEPYNTSFVIKVFSRYPKFLDYDSDDGQNPQNQKIHQQNNDHHIQESLGFITHSIINSHEINFHDQKFINEEDFFTSYTNCLSRYSRQLMSSSHEDFPRLSGVVYRSFVKLIAESTNSPSHTASSGKSNSYLIFPLLTKILESFANRPSLSLLIHRIMIDALLDAKIDRNAKEYRAIALKICASLIKSKDISADNLAIFDRLISICSHDKQLENLIRISLNQLISSHNPQENKPQIFAKFSTAQRLQALESLDFYPNNVPVRPSLTTDQVAAEMPHYLSYNEVQIFTNAARKELNLLPANLSSQRKYRRKIAKMVRSVENKYQHTKPDLINLAQTFVDYDRAFTKTIITDQNDNVLYRIGDSIYDYIAAPIKYFFSHDEKMLNFLLSELEDLNVAALDHGLDLNSTQDLASLERLKPRLIAAVKKVATHIYENDPNHPYLTFLKGFNQSSEGEMLLDVQTFMENKYPGQFICNSCDETITVKLAPRSVQYRSNSSIEISKQDFGPSKALATMQASGSITVDYENNSKISNDSFIHSFKNRNLDLKISDSIQRFIALNAKSYQFDEIFHDMITDPIIANGLSSLFVGGKSGYHKITIDERQEQIYIPRGKDSGFVFSINRNQDRTINNVVLHEGLYEYSASDDDYHPFSNDSELTPANLKELAIRLENVSKLCSTINKNARPLRDAFCELKSTKFNKKSQIEETRSAKQYKFQFRSIGKLKSGKKLYLDENGRLMVNVSLTSVKLVPISHPQPHLVNKLPIEKVSPDFDLSFSAKHFDHRRKAFHRFSTTFDVKVRKIGTYQDALNKIVTIYQDIKGRRFKSIAKSKNLQEIFDINLYSDESAKVQSILDSFKERSAIHEIFDEEKPQALIEQSNEVSIGKLQYLSSAKSTAKNPSAKTAVREVTVKPCAKSPKKSFHIDRFGVIYTKDRQNRLQKHDLNELDQDSRDTVLKSLDLSGDNLRLKKIYQLLEKNSSQEKQQVNLKPFDAQKAHIFVKNGVKYALFQENGSQDHHLMRLSYEKGVKSSKTGVIYDPDEVKLITTQLERKAIFDDLKVGSYLVKGVKTIKIEQQDYFGLTIKSFLLSDVDDKITKDSKEDKIIAIDSNLRILHKKPGEENYHIATFQDAKNLMPHFYECASQSVVKLDNWKSHYTDLMTQRQEQVQSAIDSKDHEQKDPENQLARNDLHQISKDRIKTSAKTPSTSVSNISVEQLHTQLFQR